MNKMWLILKHEFVQTVTRKGFITMAVLFPLVGFAALGIYQLVQAAGGPEDEYLPVIGYVDQIGTFTDYSGDYGDVELVPYDDPETATDDLLTGDITEFVVIPDTYFDDGVIVRFMLNKELEVKSDVYAALRDFLQNNLLEGQVSPELQERIKNPLNLQSVRLDEAGEVSSDQGGYAAFIFPMIFGFLLVITIMSSSGYLLQGLGEEKENRIMEILLSSVSPRQMLLGKVLGLGGAGLVQIVFWLVSFVFLFRLASSSIGGFFAQIQIPDNVIWVGIVYYVLGYLFFAVVMAAIGAVTSTAKESSQISIIVILPAILPFYVSFFFLQDKPDHILGTILTLIPVTAPMSVFIRLGTSVIQPWEYAASIALLVLGIIGGLWLAAKLFRVFLLMYGKTPNFKEIVRLVRQA